MRYRGLYLLTIWVGILLCGACASNRSDRNGLAKGRWRTYYDDAKKQPFTSGQYRHGRPVRTFHYYSPTGVLDHSEVYGKDGFCEVIHWYPSGKVARRGTAQWLTGAKGARFYWYGPWTSYSEDGQITSVQTYTDGTLTRAETYENGQLTQVETYKGNLRTRTETYKDGQLLRVETFENGRRTGTAVTL